MSDKKIALVAKDSATFEVSEDVAFLSDLLKDVYSLSDNTGVENGIKKIIIDRTEGIILGKLTEWMKKHEPDYKELTEKWVNARRKDAELEGWDAEFFNRLTEEELFEILDMADYMHLSPLYWQCAKSLNNNMQDLSAEEIRRIFGIKGDFTPEEAAAIKKDYAWCTEGATD